MTRDLNQEITLSSLPINAFLNCWPAATVVFIRYQMACIGCDFSGFHTPADAARVYQIPSSQFFEDLMEFMIDSDQV